MTWIKKKHANVESYIKKGSPIGYGIVTIHKYPKMEGNGGLCYSIKTSKKGSRWHRTKTKAEAEKVARTLTKEIDRNNIK
jgi:hypothetical protein